jgi:hypothetical protein
MRLWILFGAGVLVVLGAIWPFGKRTEQLGTVPANSVAAVDDGSSRTQVMGHKPLASLKPEPVTEIIDLSRAYEPVREPEEPAGAVNPASFIQVPEGPQRIPPAVDLDNPFADILRTVEECATGPFMLGAGCNDRIDVMPRVVSGATAPVERLKVMPREAIVIQREERERQTSVREDDFVGQIGP